MEIQPKKNMIFAHHLEEMRNSVCEMVRRRKPQYRVSIVPDLDFLAEALEAGVGDVVLFISPTFLRAGISQVLELHDKLQRLKNPRQIYTLWVSEEEAKKLPFPDPEDIRNSRLCSAIGLIKRMFPRVQVVMVTADTTITDEELTRYGVAGIIRIPAVRMFGIMDGMMRTIPPRQPVLEEKPGDKEPLLLPAE